MVTYLAIAFVIALIGLILYGFGFIMRRPSDVSQPGLGKCSLCQLTFEKTRLVERQIGDSKLLYFCDSCILDLQRDLSKTP